MHVSPHCICWCHRCDECARCYRLLFAYIQPTGVRLGISRKKRRGDGRQSSDKTYENSQVGIPTAGSASLSASEANGNRISTIYSLPDTSNTRGGGDSVPNGTGTGLGYSYAATSLASPINPVEVNFTQGYECASPSATLPSHYEVPVASGSVKV